MFLFFFLKNFFIINCDRVCNIVLLSFRMKSLETDAVHAQAVIAKAQELSRGSAQRPSNSASTFSTVDIAFAGQYTCLSVVSRFGLAVRR